MAAGKTTHFCFYRPKIYFLLQMKVAALGKLLQFNIEIVRTSFSQTGQQLYFFIFNFQTFFLIEVEYTAGFYILLIQWGFAHLWRET